MNQLSVIIITYNEERNIGRCIRSVQDIAAEIVVLDSFSSDRTVAISEELGARIAQQRFADFVAQKNDAVALASYDWILALDADEELTPELKRSVAETLEKPEHAAFSMPRLTNYCGRWIRYGGWYPDRKVRLFHRQKGKWAGERIHEYWKIAEGQTTGLLKGDLLHYSYNTLSDHIRKIDSFSELQAEVLFTAGKRPGMIKTILSPWWRFMNNYFFRAGFLDGFAGLVIGILSAHATFCKYAKARMKFQQTPRL